MRSGPYLQNEELINGKDNAGQSMSFLTTWKILRKLAGEVFIYRLYSFSDLVLPFTMPFTLRVKFVLRYKGDFKEVWHLLDFIKFS